MRRKCKNERVIEIGTMTMIQSLVTIVCSNGGDSSITCPALGVVDIENADSFDPFIANLNDSQTNHKLASLLNTSVLQFINERFDWFIIVVSVTYYKYLGQF